MSKKKSRSLTRPAAWVSRLPLGEPRKREILAIKESARLARRYLTGFDSKDGYDLRHPERWTAQRVATLKKYSAYVRSITSQPHIRAAPRSKKQRAALESYTGSALRGTKKFRAFAIHDPDADIAKVRVTREGNVEISYDYPGMRRVAQTFMFDDYGYDPYEFSAKRDVTDALRGLLKSGDLPSGHYQFWSRDHGVMGEPIERDDLILNYRDYWNRYGNKKGFEGVVIGVRYVGDFVDAEHASAARRERIAATEKRRGRYRHHEAIQKQLSKWRARGKKKARSKK